MIFKGKHFKFLLKVNFDLSRKKTKLGYDYKKRWFGDDASNIWKDGNKYIQCYVAIDFLFLDRIFKGPS